MIDFTPCKINRFIGYGGANGSKINISYKNASYMLKFPAIATKNKMMNYANSSISEHISCNIFNSIGIKAQETILGTYGYGDKQRVVVACKDFTTKENLMDFAQLKNTYIDSIGGGYGTELSSIIETIENQKIISPEKIKNFFWEMFIVDALIGNFDRHNGNWGLLINEEKQTSNFAPIYDCGSCLYPQITIEEMNKVLNDIKEINQRIFVYPTSAIMDKNKKISYFDYISSIKNKDCNRALKNIFPKINLKEINEIIEEVSILKPIQKDFYQNMIKERYNKILEFSFQKLLKLESEKEDEWDLEI